MTRTYLRIAAAGLAAAPATAWAHGDHHGLHGIVHVLSEPAHLGLVIAAGIVAVAIRRALQLKTRRAKVAQPAKVRRD